MSILRSDKEVALNDLLVAIRESVDHYRDASAFLDAGNLTQLLASIGARREAFIPPLENAVRALGDLPSVPDPDKETGAMLVHHAAALLSENYAANVINQRLEAEQHIVELINAGRAAGLEEYCGNLMDLLDEHVAQTIKQLQGLPEYQPVT
jgi:hypothetical protein